MHRITSRWPFLFRSGGRMSLRTKVVALDIEAPCNASVAFEPSDLVVFTLDTHGVKHFRHVTMRNLHTRRPTIFSVKTLNPERYFIKPSKGTLGPSETIQIKIELRQALYDEIALRQNSQEAYVTDRLLIQSGTPSTESGDGACRESLAFRGKDKSAAKDHAWATAWKALGPRDIMSKNFVMRFEPTIEFTSHTPHVLLQSGASVLSQTSAFSVDPPPSETTMSHAHFLASIDDSAPLPLSASVVPKKNVSPKTPSARPLPSQVVPSRVKADRSGLLVAITPAADILLFTLPPHEVNVGSCDVSIENRCSKVVAYTVRIESKFKCKAVPFKVGWLDGPDKTNVRLELAPSLHRELLQRLRSHDTSPLPQYKVRVQCMELELSEIAAMTSLPSYDQTIEYLKDLWHHASDANKKILVHKYVTSFALEVTAPVPIDRSSDAPALRRHDTDDDVTTPDEGRASEVSECASFQTAFTRAPPMRPIMTPLEHLQYQRSLNQHLLPRNTIDDFRETLFDDMPPSSSNDTPPSELGPATALEGVKEGDDEDATSSHLSNAPPLERPFATSVDTTRPRPASPLRRQPSASVGATPKPATTTKIDLLASMDDVLEEEKHDDLEPLPVSIARPTEYDARSSTVANRDTVAHVEYLPMPETIAEASASPRRSSVRFSLDDIDILASKYMPVSAPAKPKPSLSLVPPPPVVAAPVVHPPAPVMWAPMPTSSSLSPRHDVNIMASPVVAVAINMNTPRSSLHVREDLTSESSMTVDSAFASFMGPLSPAPSSPRASVSLFGDIDTLPTRPVVVIQETTDDDDDDDADDHDKDRASVVEAPVPTTPVTNPEVIAVDEPDADVDGPSSPSSKAHTIDDANSGFSILTFPEPADATATADADDEHELASVLESSTGELEPVRQGSGRSFFPKAILKTFAFKETPDEPAHLEMPDEAWIRQSEFDARHVEQPPKKMKSFLRAFEKNYAVSTPTPTGLVSLSPQTLLYHLDVGKKPTGKVTLQNTSSHCVAFKIKTAQPQRYKVRPNQGYMEPQTSFAIDINLHQVAYDELMCYSNVELSDVRDCLLVETIAMPNKKNVLALKASTDPNSLLKVLWANTEKKAIHASRLFCEYAFDDSQYHSFSSSNTGSSSFMAKDAVGPRLDRIESLSSMDESHTPPPSPRRIAKKPVLRDAF
ncbi:hypothetical protein SDRG_05134 [Saprolegnia diclina VS20]|uniref:MSP domain-containing protein n=1 Tax=Saprolegnia diclina (strain VS20) TaxID=1156394 RepID=T0RYB3_SAPDV|nr:hypothetical protein SDRG_05134 [Saprolegnia diclina VS20]EQC37533.1 hypothetical protein SDRG_05134 [Saprolegnia diclina VS20]|eukprot:XP_008609053.1 hypothetical protein SDRG_05134 [Saprolegnia diclina VS20]